MPAAAHVCGMKTVLVGVGQAGGKVATALSSFDSRMQFGAVLDVVAVNTAEADLAPLDCETVLVGQERVGGHGVGGDNELGAEVMDADAREVMSALDDTLTARAESVTLVAGLGGGTGSGGAPVLARELKRVYDVPVYGLGVLPGRDEGALYQVNAGRSLKTFAREADAVLLVDNDAWRESGESVAAGYESVNEAIARRVGLLLAAGEATEGVGESVVDSSEVINTLRGGGMAALGYASAEAAADPAANVNTVTSLARRALHTGTSLPDATTAESALFVVAGHPDRIPRKGVERARRWVEEETGSLAVRGGDFPLQSERLAALVLLGGVERSGRVDEFMDRARRAAQEAGELDAEREDPATAFQNDDIDSLM
jgi:cell division GTPase FtsZ